MNNQLNKGFIKNPFLIILSYSDLGYSFSIFNADQQVATQEISYSQVITELKMTMYLKLHINLIQVSSK